MYDPGFWLSVTYQPALVPQVCEHSSECVRVELDSSRHPRLSMSIVRGSAGGGAGGAGAAVESVYNKQQYHSQRPGRYRNYRMGKKRGCGRGGLQ